EAARTSLLKGGKDLISRRCITAVAMALIALLSSAGCGGGDASVPPPTSTQASESAPPSSRPQAHGPGESKSQLKQVAKSDPAAVRHGPERANKARTPNSEPPIREGAISDPEQIRQVVKEMIAGGADESDGGTPAATPAEIVREVLGQGGGQDQAEEGEGVHEALEKILQQVRSEP
ncbi:MAG TPA: hypothetical protein VFI03_06925, partial [Solirubrobacterales bacterium]|nr:hypothetical protein [Solirubrobacterales bacterium]